MPSGNFNTEFVLCPLAGECCEFGIVCNSQESTELSNREVNTKVDITRA